MGQIQDNSNNEDDKKMQKSLRRGSNPQPHDDEWMIDGP